MAANIIKKPGPPVPPRPQHTTSTTTSLIATSLRTISAAATTPTTTSTFTTNSQNNGSIVTKTNNHSQTITSFIKTTTTTTTNNSSINKNEENTTNNNSNHKQNPPIIHKKPIMTRQTSQSGAGRTVIYKSPTISMQQRQEQISNATGVGGVTSETNSTSVSMRNTSSAIVAPKPPLKLRKAPDVPKSQQQLQNQTQTNTISLNRHNSMGCTSSPKTSVGLKETRLSLGRADLDKFGKIQLNQLQLSSQPLPKPRKIVQMPVATMDMEDKITTPSTTSKTNSMANIFRRSKTSLDNSLNSVSGNGSTMANLSSPNRFLSGKTVEIKNNLKNAAERLFAEIIVSQHNKHATEPTPTIITKHERAIQHTTTMIPQQQQYQQQQSKQHKLNTVTVAVNTSPGKANVPNSNYTRICINANSPATTPTTPLLNGTDSITKLEKKKPIESLFNSPEKKQAFHEILISELAAMRTRSSSMENLQTNCNNENNNHQIEDIVKSSIPQNQLESVQSNTRLRCNSVEEFDEDQDDVDVDVDVDPNTDISNMDEDLLRKKLKLGNKHASRKRCPSGCSSDSSPYGTERSARIRTSDWVEVQDNGKQVTLTSCHISLEDSGLEDEERLDDISTSGVGDSWDSVKETHNEQRLRNIKR